MSAPTETRQRRDDMRLSDLFARRTWGIRLGLVHVRRAHQALGAPSASLPAVHVVGTNGKGSVAAMCEHALRGRGHRVGLYTSPHLVAVNERIRVDGTPIDDAALTEAVDRVLALESRDDARPLSFFEVLTLAALWVFEEAGVELVVAEAGLGGRLDATRLVSPQAIAVTSIALDHQALLGDTLQAIAAEKAGVFRRGIPVYCGPQPPEVADVLAACAGSTGAPWCPVLPLAHPPEGLPGDQQRSNAAVALAAAAALDPSVCAEHLDGVRWPGRLERCARGDGVLWFDVGHNPAAIEVVVAHLRPRTRPESTVVVFGCTPDRPAASMLGSLRALGATWWVDLSASERSETAPGLCSRTFTSATDPALLTALDERLADGGTVVVCGSHRLVGPVRSWAQGDGGVDGDVAVDPSEPALAPGGSDPVAFGGADSEPVQ